MRRLRAFEPPYRLAFTWNAPPKFPDIRAQRTMEIVELSSRSATATRLRFTQLGWGRGPHWDATYDYFDHAWNGQVLPFLVYRFEHGPIDWNAMPEPEPAVASMKLALAPASGGR